ncbi:MAG: hypothetical protein ACTIC2_00820 [Enterococcus devriesei]|uniref:hypothetical protein n=1 Tax=Enterococcus devriesei TaxID=319970 RepID=UPI003F90E7A3
MARLIYGIHLAKPTKNAFNSHHAYDSTSHAKTRRRPNKKESKFFQKLRSFSSTYHFSNLLKQEEKLTASSNLGMHFAKPAKNAFDSHRAYDSTSPAKTHRRITKKESKFFQNLRSFSSAYHFSNLLKQEEKLTASSNFGMHFAKPAKKCLILTAHTIPLIPLKREVELAKKAPIGKSVLKEYYLNAMKKKRLLLVMK